MIQLIQLLIITLLTFFSPQVLAEKVSVDDFFKTFDSSKNYQPDAIPVVENITGGPSVLGTVSTPVSLTVTIIPTLAHYLPENLQAASRQSYLKSILFVLTKSLSSIPDIERFQKVHDYTRAFFCTFTKSCIKEATQTIIQPLLVLMQESGLFSKFQGNPFSSLVPEKIKEVYEWDKLWNPAIFPNSYLQCTAFVAMIYNLNNISLYGRIQGDAREWIYNTETFHVYRSGSATSAPEILDTVVWADQGRNHVGIIIEKEGTKVRVINANSDKTEYWYRYHRNFMGYYSITDLEGRTSVEAWVPSHWLRVRD